MSRLFYHVMQDNAGNLLFDVSGTMRLAGTGTLATIYGDEALTVPLANPMTNHPSFGSFKCFLGPGDYDFYLAKSGYTFETLTGVQGSGTMADQNANAVLITGGSAVLGSATMTTANVSTTLYVGLGTPPGNTQQHIFYNKETAHGLTLSPADNNTGSGAAINFQNTAGAIVGNIVTTVSTTAYNTASDARLKQAITPLAGALDVVRALRPVAFRWCLDGSPGRGLLAQEVAAVVPGVVSGDEAGTIPMAIDYSKLVPYLIGAVKELTMQVEGLTARLAAAGA